MSTMAAGRILWKEYRAHRALWLSCVGASLFFQLLTASRWFGHLSELILACAYFFPMMYALGCGAILFAGEREERTSDWLLALSAPAAPTVAAKICFAFLSTLAMQIALVFAALILDGPALGGTMKVLVMPHLIALAVLIWSVFGSLVSRRGLVSIIAGLFWGVAMNAGPQCLLACYTDSLRRTVSNDAGIELLHARLLFFTIALTIILDLWLAWRWCQGQYLDGSIVDGLNAYFAGQWSETKAQFSGWRFPLQRPAGTATAFAAEFGQPWRRTWQRLIWQERRRESMHVLLLIAGSGLAVVTSVLSWGARDWLTMLTLICVFPAPLIMGVLGFRADNGRQQPRFLSNRGISPVSLWLAKQVVWLWRAIWIPSVILTISFFMESTIAEFTMTRPTPPIQQMFRDFSSRPDLVCWALIFGYAAGQLAAILFDRAVLALGFGIVLNLLGATWMSLIEGLEIPQWWSLGLPVVAMLLITLWQMYYWLLEDHSFGRRCRLTLGLMLPVLCLCVAVPCYRVGAAVNWKEFNPASAIMWQHEFRQQQLSLTDSNATALWRLRALAEQPTRSDDEIDEVFRILQGPITTLASQQPGEIETGAARSVTSTNGRGWQSLHEGLRGRAIQFRQAGQADRARDYLLASLKLARFSATRGALAVFLAANQQQKMALEQIIDLAAATGDAAALRQLVQQELQQFPSLSESAVAEYLAADRLWVQSPEAELVAFAEGYGQSAPRYSPPALMMAAPWERRRLSLVLSHQSQLEFMHIQNLEHQQSLVWTDVPKPLNGSARLAELARTTPPASSLINLDHIPRLIFDRRVFVRAALIRLAVLSFRENHGRLPTDLLELAEQKESISLIDPYSGAMFQYVPAFLSSSGPEGISLQPNADGLIRIGFAVRNAIEVDRDAVWITAARLLSHDPAEVIAVQTQLKHPEYIFPIPPLPAKTP